MKILVLLAILLLASQPATTLITIDSSGVVEAHLRLSVAEGLNEVKLPAEPIPETIEIRINGKHVAAIYENDALIFFSPAPGEAEISYLVNVSARDNILSFSVVEEGLIELRISPQIILLTAPRSIESIEHVEGDLVIEFHGPEEIEYAVRAGEITRPTATAPTTQAATEITEKAENTKTTMIPTPSTSTRAPGLVEEPGERPADHTAMVIVIAVLVLAASAVAAIIYAAVIFARSRRKKTLGENWGLTSLDRRILEAIESAGGSILQGELQAILGLPKTTLWRHVRKLGKLGYIEIVKEGALNRLILLKKPS